MLENLQEEITETVYLGGCAIYSLSITYIEVFFYSEAEDSLEIYERNLFIYILVSNKIQE